MTSHSNKNIVRSAAYSGVAALLAACTSFPVAKPPDTAGVPPVVAGPKPADIDSYIALFDQLAPGNPERQYAAVSDLASLALREPTATNRLKYALALGAAGRADSNPVEARRLIADLLAEQSGLQPREVSLANAWLREYDARVALYADLARVRDETERKLRDSGSEDDKRIAALNSENQRLRKALADAERKLEAVAEMERSLAPPEGQQP
ncbi:MAG: hypothetical protein ACR2I8_03400 [Steroidobacteraceae bacterium]